MAELNVIDILPWAPQLQLISEGQFYATPDDLPRWLERELSWVVSVRASAPVLPNMRGGELVLAPSRVMADNQVALSDVMREIAARGAAAIVLDAPPAQPAPLPVFLADSLPLDLEGDLNRTITEQRGEMYRIASALGHSLSVAVGSGQDLPAILSTAGEMLESPIGVIDRTGRFVTTGDLEQFPHELGAVSLNGSVVVWQDWMGYQLPHGERLWIGDATPIRRPLLRLAIERISPSVERVLNRAAEVRPRGPARAMALAALLRGSPEEAARSAPAIGLHSHAIYRVAIAPESSRSGSVARTLSPLGHLHEAGLQDGNLIHVIEQPSERVRLPRQIAGGDDDHWIAVSQAVMGPSSLPEAARQSRFIAALRGKGALSGQVIGYDDPARMGIYQVLFQLWGTPEFDRFRTNVLGELIREDRRGVLQETLLAWLAAGGTQIEAADKLGIHRNTLSYRMRQISTLTNVDLDNVSTRLALHLALLAESLPVEARA